MHWGKFNSELSSAEGTEGIMSMDANLDNDFSTDWDTWSNINNGLSDYVTEQQIINSLLLSEYTGNVVMFSGIGYNSFILWCGLAWTYTLTLTLLSTKYKKK